MIEAAIYDLLNESIKVEKLLKQTEVYEYFSRTATYDNRFIKRDYSYSFGKGQKSCLLFSFGQSGEAVGGTGLVTLANLLQRDTCNFRNMPVTWHFAPGLDLLTSQGITTFRAMLQDLQPDFIFAMPDSLSEGPDGSAQTPEQSARFLVKHALPEKHRSMIRSMFTKSGIEIDNAVENAQAGQFGEGFFLANATNEPFLAEIPADCQFLQPIFGRVNDLLPADLVFLQMAIGLVGIDSITQ